MRPKVLFVQPDYYRYFVQYLPNYEPLVCLLLAACVKDLAECRVFDRRFDSERNLRKVIREFQPDIVATRTHTAGEIFTALRIMKVAKEEDAAITTVIGGQHPTLLPEDLFASQTDVICIGPGEEAIREIVQTRAEYGASADYSGIAGLAVRWGEHYIFSPARPPCSGTISWPTIDHSLADSYRKHYFNTFHAKPVGFTLTSMGCPYRCKFCSLWVAARGTYRRRSPEEIVEDLAGQPYDFIHITDDNTFHNEAHAMEVLRLLRKRNVKKQYLAYARADTIVSKPHLFEAWKEVGLAELVVGMEACTDGHLDFLNKRTSEDENVRAHRELERIGIRNWAHFIVMPDFEVKDFDRIWNFIEELNICYPIFVPLTPIPGTPLFFEAKDRGDLTTYDYGFYNLMYMTMKTRLPKRVFYRKMMELYAKSSSAWTLRKRRRTSPTYDDHIFRTRARMGHRMIPRYMMNALRQLWHEKWFSYDEAEADLPPSLRRDYKPVNYYNAPTVAAMELPEAGAAEPERERVLVGV